MFSNEQVGHALEIVDDAAQGTMLGSAFTIISGNTVALSDIAINAAQEHDKLIDNVGMIAATTSGLGFAAFLGSGLAYIATDSLRNRLSREQPH